MYYPRSETASRQGRLCVTQSYLIPLLQKEWRVPKGKVTEIQTKLFKLISVGSFHVDCVEADQDNVRFCSTLLIRISTAVEKLKNSSPRKTVPKWFFVVALTQFSRNTVLVMRPYFRAGSVPIHWNQCGKESRERGEPVPYPR